jgi:putative oxidoreductase
MEASVMTDDQLRSYGVLLLRLALGTMFIAHSVIYMLMTLTLAGTAEFFVSIGLPAWLAYATFFAEAVGGIFLILGIQARWVALALSPILIGATWAHSGNGWLFASTEGGWEYPLRSLHRPGHARRRRLRPSSLTVRCRRHQLPTKR